MLHYSLEDNIMAKRRLKRGQSASGAATLVAIVTLIIVLYILFLPPEDRGRLLGDDEEDEGNGNIDNDDKEHYTIESWHVGFLEHEGITEYEHPLPTLNLEVKAGDESIYTANAFQVRNGWFENSMHNVTFDIPKFQNTDNIFLSFQAPIKRGTLMIKLNGEILAQTRLDTKTPPPIDISKDDLKSTDNVLEFSVDGVGIKFWTTNMYEINNLEIFGEVTDTTNQDALPTFTVTEREKDNLQSAKLKFNLECIQSRVGKLDIWLNSYKIFSQVPDCQILNTIEVSPRYIEEGQNTVEFKTYDGTYVIDQIKVMTELEEVIFPVYYFDLNNSEYDALKDNEAKINITIRFADEEEFKQAKVFINGHIRDVNQYEMEWSRSVSTYVERKNNAVKIEPRSRLNIREMKIEFVEN